MCFRSILNIYNFVYYTYTEFWLETTFLVYLVGEWVAGLIGNITNSAPTWLGLGLSLAKFLSKMLKCGKS